MCKADFYLHNRDPVKKHVYSNSLFFHWKLVLIMFFKSAFYSKNHERTGHLQPKNSKANLASKLFQLQGTNIRTILTPFFPKFGKIMVFVNTFK